MNSRLDEDDTATENPQAECDFCKLRQEEINCLLKDNMKLRSELGKRELDEKILQDDNAKVKYYTGLPCFTILMGVLTHIIPFLPQTR